MKRKLLNRFEMWFSSLSTIQTAWFYVALMLLLASTVLHNPTAGYSRDQLYFTAPKVETPFPSSHMYYWCYYSGDSDRENGLRYLKLGPQAEALEASGIGPEAIGVKMRQEYELYEQHKKADLEKEEEWARANGWLPGEYPHAAFSKPNRWDIDPRAWNSNGSIVSRRLPNLTNLWSYLNSIIAILSLTGLLGWLAGVRAKGSPHFQEE